MHPGQGYGNAARMSRERQDIENERRKIEREITQSRVGCISYLFFYLLKSVLKRIIGYFFIKF